MPVLKATNNIEKMAYIATPPVAVSVMSLMFTVLSFQDTLPPKL